MLLETLTQPFINLWGSFVIGLGMILPALIAIALGLFFGKGFYKIIVKILKKAKIDELAKPFAGAVERAGYQLHISHLIAWLVKWFIIIASLIIALDFLKLQSAQELLTGIVAYIPQVIIAIFILFAGFLLGDFVKKIIKTSTKMLNFKSAAMLGNIARTAVVVLSILLAMDLLGIGQNIIMTLFVGVVAMLSLAGGLAFGLGGQNAAQRAVEDIKNSLHK